MAECEPTISSDAIGEDVAAMVVGRVPSNTVVVGVVGRVDERTRREEDSLGGTAGVLNGDVVVGAVVSFAFEVVVSPSWCNGGPG